mmetsp:Transcript_10063/g.21005  ORF Transcript_10063/g.21005 Transcript_10063/m.21005 type:complete len:276 (-) Transcript_10063:16-843(-)
MCSSRLVIEAKLMFSEIPSINFPSMPWIFLAIGTSLEKISTVPTKTPSSSPTTISPGLTSIPPQFTTGACISPGDWVVPEYGVILVAYIRMGFVVSSSSRWAVSRIGPSMTIPARPFRRASPTKISPATARVEDRVSTTKTSSASASRANARITGKKSFGSVNETVRAIPAMMAPRSRWFMGRMLVFINRIPPSWLFAIVFSASHRDDVSNFRRSPKRVCTSDDVECIRRNPNNCNARFVLGMTNGETIIVSANEGRKLKPKVTSCRLPMAFLVR